MVWEVLVSNYIIAKRLAEFYRFWDIGRKGKE